MTKATLRAVRIKAVLRILQRPTLSAPMFDYWTKVLAHLSTWDVEKRNARILTQPMSDMVKEK